MKFTASNIAPFSLFIWVLVLTAAGLQMTAWYPWWPGIYTPTHAGLGVVLLFVAFIFVLLASVRIVFPRTLLSADRRGIVIHGSMGRTAVPWTRIEHAELGRSFVDNTSGNRQVMCVVLWIRDPEAHWHRAVRPHGWFVGKKLYFPVPPGWDDEEALASIERLRWGQV